MSGPPLVQYASTLQSFAVLLLRSPRKVFYTGAGLGGIGIAAEVDFAALALTVGERSETENLRPVLGRLGEFSDLFLARSEASLWSPTFSDLFWPTSEPSIATHSTGPGIRRRDTRVHRTTTKNRSFSLFSFPNFVVRIVGYYSFEYRSLQARLQIREARFATYTIATHNVHVGRHAGPAGPAE